MARVAFLQNFWFEFLGPQVLSAVLKEAGHEVRLFIGRNERDLIRQCRDFKPQIAAFSTSSGSQHFAYRVGKAFRQTFGAFSVMGGAHPTFYPDAIKSDGVDAICRGEGEYAMLDLVNAIDGGGDVRDIPNLWVKQNGEIYENDLRPLVADLDSLPLPDRSLYYEPYAFLRNCPNRNFVTTRGCPFDCSYCCNKGYTRMYAGKGEMVRRPSVDRVLEEIREVRDRWGLGSVRFDDDVFTLDMEFLRAFLPRYAREIGLPFTCLTRADITDEEMVKLLADGGCHMVYFGLESGDEELRQQVLHKTISDDQIVNTARLLHKYGLKIGTFNMLGLPGETLEHAYRTVRLNQRIGAHYPWCSVLQPYPATELEQYAKEKGYLSPDASPDDLGTSYFNRSILKNRKDGKALESLHKFFFLAVRAPFLWPLIRGLIKLPPNPAFDVVFWLTYGYRYVKTYQISLPRLAHTAWKLRGQF